MKKFTLLTFIACFSIFSGTGLLGQVAQAKKQMSLGIQNGFSMKNSGKSSPRTMAKQRKIKKQTKFLSKAQ